MKNAQVKCNVDNVPINLHPLPNNHLPWPSKHWTQILNKSKQSTSKTCRNVCDAVKDPFTILKLMFFSFVCGLVEPYLKVFQSDRPVVPFIYSEVKSVIKSLLSLIVKPSIIEKSKSATDLKNVNLSSK